MSWDDIEDSEQEIEAVMEEISGSDNEFEIEESLQDLLASQQEVMESAKIRLAQGRLYEMLLKHDLFDDGIGEDPRAIKKVQAEVRAFVTERLEIMLGMRQPKSRSAQPVIQSVKVELPFNEVEVDALKAIASKLSKGQSEGLSNLEIEARVNLANNTDIKKEKTSAVPKQAAPPVRKPVSPISNKKPLDRKNLPKPAKTGKELYQMSEEELANYAKERTLLPKVGRPSDVKPLPMPDPAVADMMAAEAADRNARGTASSNPALAGFNSWVAQNLRGAVPVEEKTR